MNGKIIITVNGKVVSAREGTALSDIIELEKPCGGHGKCGKCKIKAKGELSTPSEQELKLLTPAELEDGVRLACLTYALGDCEIKAFTASADSQIVTDGDLPEFDLKPTFSNYGIAIDIGTTTLASRLYGADGRILAQTSRINPQQEWGADVISRIEAALGGKAEPLARAIRGALDGMIRELSDTAGIEPMQADGLVITGNTVMLSLFVGEDVEPFSHAPFTARRLFGETLSAGELELSSLNPDTPIYISPCASAFVGADAICAVLATQLCTTDKAMLADIGTNGEMAIYRDGRLTVCSTAAGPAFEGVGISMGMRGSDGAIDRVSAIGEELTVHVIGDGEPIGICGSGLVDAVACMLELELLDETGYLEDDPFTVKAPVALNAKDIRMLQLAKSAICAGLLTLMENEGLDPSDIPVLYIAGGFGKYLNKHSAARIGLLPSAVAAHSKAVGNAALAGASMLLLNGDFRFEAEITAKNAVTLELSSNPTFSEYYMSGMMLESI